MSKTMAYERKIIFNLAYILNNVFIASHSTWFQERSNVTVPDHRGKRVAPFSDLQVYTVITDTLAIKSAHALLQFIKLDSTITNNKNG
jgi:hypothetical protein